MLRRGFMTAAVAAALGSAAAQTPADAPPAPIVPQNALEHSFVAALTNPAMRPIFRRQLLEGHVALALSGPPPNAPPREITIPSGARAGLIFTSAARLNSVLGPDTPRIVLTGRAALQRLRGKSVVINVRLAPMLTLEADDIARYLETPVTPGSAGPAQ